MRSAGTSWPATRRRAAVRIAVVAALAVPVGACATKRDLKDLRDEVIIMQMRQDSLFRVMQMQTRMLLDTVRVSFDLQQNVRGDIGFRMTELLQRLQTVEELLGQQQVQFAEFRERSDQILRAGGGSMVVAGGGAAPLPGGGVAAGEDARTYYELGMQKIAEGSYATARLAFEGLLREYPADALAPDAHYQLAETFYLEGNADRALDELERVPQQWPTAARAPQALLRAGVIAEEQGDADRARRSYEQVVQRYGQSEERRQAEARLRSLPRR
jgi:tol-pal system protein YbgF